MSTGDSNNVRALMALQSVKHRASGRYFGVEDQAPSNAGGAARRSLGSFSFAGSSSSSASGPSALMTKVQKAAAQSMLSSNIITAGVGLRLASGAAGANPLAMLAESGLAQKASSAARGSSNLIKRNGGRGIICYKCKQRGHTAIQCPEGGGLPPCNICAAFHRPGEYCRADDLCHLCDERGHIVRDCPNAAAVLQSARSSADGLPLGYGRRMVAAIGPLAASVTTFSRTRQEAESESSNLLKTKLATAPKAEILKRQYCQLCGLKKKEASLPPPIGSSSNSRRSAVLGVVCECEESEGNSADTTCGGGLELAEDLGAVTCCVCGREGHACCGLGVLPKKETRALIHAATGGDLSNLLPWQPYASLSPLAEALICRSATERAKGATTLLTVPQVAALDLANDDIVKARKASRNTAESGRGHGMSLPGNGRYSAVHHRYSSESDDGSNDDDDDDNEEHTTDDDWSYDTTGRRVSSKKRKQKKQDKGGASSYHEGLPESCFNCGKQGHDGAACPRVNSQPQVEPFANFPRALEEQELRRPSARKEAFKNQQKAKAEASSSSSSASSAKAAAVSPAPALHPANALLSAGPTASSLGPAPPASRSLASLVSPPLPGPKGPKEDTGSNINSQQNQDKSVLGKRKREKEAEEPTATVSSRSSKKSDKSEKKRREAAEEASASEAPPRAKRQKQATLEDEGDGGKREEEAGDKGSKTTPRGLLPLQPRQSAATAPASAQAAGESKTRALLPLEPRRGMEGGAAGSQELAKPAFSPVAGEDEEPSSTGIPWYDRVTAPHLVAERERILSDHSLSPAERQQLLGKLKKEAKKLGKAAGQAK